MEFHFSSTGFYLSLSFYFLHPTGWQKQVLCLSDVRRRTSTQLARDINNSPSRKTRKKKSKNEGENELIRKSKNLLLIQNRKRGKMILGKRK